MYKKLVFGLAVVLFCFNAQASTYVPCAEDEAETCWPCGETCAARLTYQTPEDAQNKTNATLTFSGTGSTDNYDTLNRDLNPELINVEPWLGVRNSISKVVVDEGITKLGSRTVYYMEHLQEVVLPESLESIGQRAFYSSKLENIVIPENVQTIGQYAFQGTRIGEMLLPEATESFSKAFLCESEKETCKALPLATIYCSSKNAEKCASAVSTLGITPIIYEKASNGQYFYNGRWYNSAKDIVNGNHIKKLRYTVEEAMRATEHGDKFHVFLTYK